MHFREDIPFPDDVDFWALTLLTFYIPSSYLYLPSTLSCYTSFQHKMIHRYTWARGNDRSLNDNIAVDNRLRREVEDAKVVRGMFSGSDYFAVVVKVRMRERWEFKGMGKKKVKGEN